jgi:hypothetical protein
LKKRKPETAVKYGTSRKSSKPRKLKMNSELQVSMDNIKAWIETGMKSFSGLEDGQTIELPWEYPFVNIKVKKEEASTGING